MRNACKSHPFTAPLPKHLDQLQIPVTSSPVKVSQPAFIHQFLLPKFSTNVKNRSHAFTRPSPTLEAGGAIGPFTAQPPAQPTAIGNHFCHHLIVFAQRPVSTQYNNGAVSTFTSVAAPGATQEKGTQKAGAGQGGTGENSRGKKNFC